jgi:acyl-CoA thioester hydrolase
MAKNEADEICFTGRGTMVQISAATGKGKPWTAEEKARFADPQAYVSSGN